MEVPGEAHDTGYHTDQVQLWVSVADGQEAAYLVGPTGKPNAGPRSSSDARDRILTLAIPHDVGSSAATLGEPPSRLWVPEIRSWPLTSTFAYLQLVLKAAPSGPKSVLKVSSDG